MIDKGTPSCCSNSCGRLVPLVTKGNYIDPTGDGKTHITFNLSGSVWCGISVARVLRGDVEGLAGRDDLAGLNRRSNSMRLRIEVSNPSAIGRSNQTNFDRQWPGYDVFTPKVGGDAKRCTHRFPPLILSQCR